MRAPAIGFVALAAIAACSLGPSSSSGGSAAVDSAPAAPASFINRVWVVTESEQVAKGDLRVFLSDGTLVMTSRHGTPAFGTWRYQDGGLRITEEGQEYPVDILELGADAFRIRIRGPGEPVVIRFRPAEQPAVRDRQDTDAGG